MPLSRNSTYIFEKMEENPAEMHSFVCKPRKEFRGKSRLAE
jgi:hypothetical protein